MIYIVKRQNQQGEPQDVKLNVNAEKESFGSFIKRVVMARKEVENVV